MSKKSLQTSKRLVLILFIAIFSFQPLEVLAARDLEYDSSNDNLYFGEGGCKAAAGGSSTGSIGAGKPLIGATNKEKVWNFLTGKDGNIPAGDALDAKQAAGVMGNLQQESGFDPTVEEKTTRAEKGYGIAQWTFDRRTALENAAKGVAVSDLGFQLSFMYQESKSRKVSGTVAGQNPAFGPKGANEWATLKKQTTIENAVVFWHNNFEVSADTPSQVLSGRGGPARDIYAEFTGNTAPTDDSSSAGGSTSKCSSDGAAFTGGDLSATTLAYAWPEYHAPPYANNKPEYQAAMVKAKAAGQYVGGGTNGQIGVDCGAFVSRLLIDSGFETAYNSSGKGGNTVSQKNWAEANWETLPNNISTASLRPGDVAFSPGHTFIWVGTVPGFDSKIASASYSTTGRSWRSPMAGHESPTASNVTWYRKKG